jgi:nitroreductase
MPATLCCNPAYHLHMEKVANAAYPIHDLIAHRWSPRAFADRPVETQKLQSVMEAARWAPSSSNEQPWYYILATKDQPADHLRLPSCLVEKNQQWARHAPVLMIAAAALQFRKHGTANRHAYYDLGQSAAYLTLQATALGLYVHQMAGFSPGTARRELQFPEGVEPVTAIAMGYLGDPQHLPEDLRHRELAPSARRETKEFVYAGRWGQSPQWLGA